MAGFNLLNQITTSIKELTSEVREIRAIVTTNQMLIKSNTALLKELVHEVSRFTGKSDTMMVSAFAYATRHCKATAKPPTQETTNMSDDFKVDIDKAVRDAEKAERVIEIEALMMRMSDEKIQRENRRLAKDAGLIDSETELKIRAAQKEANDLIQQARLHKSDRNRAMRGLVRDRDGNYRDFNGNKFDSNYNKIEDEGEWQ